ncbi:hypothetical protein JCM10914A_13240 [Paenibacillus sp. JCM 10914]|uniref:HugZ family pyridoxamine 5'-phosphate oxidase n=1 Tax=Paenibacillus sp. JCM 10914 TaxID=1236974 RepID=UPI0003CC44FD|nr:pyridoxamine 5'-phosphate oxidase family protein [Paenibacillus sp. JCM 10914]GAE08604.1 hypothetical protein JCM10914_4909 [Paenibacillus sp. JCM 10914]
MKVMDTEASKKQYMEFANGLKSLILSTIDETGRPFISYAPFVQTQGKFYIYISRIAPHYRHLEEQGLVDVMLIADEVSTSNLFARERARFTCVARNIGEEGYEEIFELFAETFSTPMMTMLRGLDFSLFELAPSAGRYVAGFGQAYDIDLTADRFEHVAREGHGQSVSNAEKS